MHDSDSAPASAHRSYLAKLTLLALGVVYGDIGTSPLYALRECFKAEHGLPPLPVTMNNVYGIMSLIVWALIMVVAIKYIVFIMRADNEGEGGILALLALLMQREQRGKRGRKRRATLVALGLIGAALLYGDGVITPAISVLGAVEGLEVTGHQVAHLVVPVSVVILIGLFLLQRHGTEGIGRLFGPIMGVWFLTIGTFGLLEILREPHILVAMNPFWAVRFFVAHGPLAFVLLGAVVLVVTGAEALYADMGHFGRRPIRIAWFGLVLPCLLLNYFGQGALLLREPAAIANPFYLLAPKPLLYPYIALATMAAIIASQALISGAFSLTQQSIQLDYSPRLHIVHTSKHERGQIYMPGINAALMVSCVIVVLGFGSSSALGAAYGIAVTGTMGITTILFAVLARSRWGWSLWKAGLFAVIFLTIDLAFFGANILKVAQGGWVPLLIAMGMFILMTTWHKGRVLSRGLMEKATLPMDMFLEDVVRTNPIRVPGTAVFLTANPHGAPLVLLHHLKHNKMLHQHVVLLSVIVEQVPEVPERERIEITELPADFHRVIARYGFMESPNVQHVIQHMIERGTTGGIRNAMDVTYFLGRERLLATGSSRMARWRKRLFIVMYRNARTVSEFFRIPPNRVVELSAQLEL